VVPVFSDVSEERIASIFRAGGEHGATPQKNIFCIVTTVKTSNLTESLLIEIKLTQQTFYYVRKTAVNLHELNGFGDAAFGWTDTTSTLHVHFITYSKERTVNEQHVRE
jgi:hypothetical protein